MCDLSGGGIMADTHDYQAGVFDGHTLEDCRRPGVAGDRLESRLRQLVEINRTDVDEANQTSSSLEFAQRELPACHHR